MQDALLSFADQIEKSPLPVHSIEVEPGEGATVLVFALAEDGSPLAGTEFELEPGEPLDDDARAWITLGFSAMAGLASGMKGVPG